MEKVIFWGAGNVGKAILTFWKRLGICPDFFCDNAEGSWGTKINGVKVLSPTEVYSLEGDKKIFITCARYADIERQMMEAKVIKEQILVADSIRSPEMLFFLADVLLIRSKISFAIKRDGYGCLIDLSGGMVLGGVERWSYALAGTLNRLGFKSAYMVPESSDRVIMDEQIPSFILKDKKEVLIVSTIKTIVDSGTRNVICNFPFEILIASCIVKKYIDQKLNIIAIIHNDEEIYYRGMMACEKYIDMCLVISSKIKSGLLERGFPSSKMKELYWRVPCKKRTQRRYSGEGTMLNIGYAGRVTIRQKRVDLFLPLAEKLKKKSIRFCITIAGSGDHIDRLRRDIIEMRLEQNVKVVGIIEHEDMMDFWEKQDICLSCSEWEGHSISHSEAMAAGAVLVITDTSGARDDVENGINGFIADVGDVEMLERHIVYLYEHREMLEKMGKVSIKKILARNRYMEPEDYWNALLI